MEGLFDLLKYYAFEGGVIGIVNGAFLLIGVGLIATQAKNKNTLIIVFMILFFLLGAMSIFFGGYSAFNSKTITASRLIDKHWAVQLETDDTIQDALQNKKRFQHEFKDLVIILHQDKEANKPRFYLFNLYFTELEADNGKDTAHRNWQKFGYEEKYKDSASTKNLTDLCKRFVQSEDGRYFICNND